MFTNKGSKFGFVQSQPKTGAFPISNGELNSWMVSRYHHVELDKPI